MCGRPVFIQPSREAVILEHLGAAQLLFERDGSPASEQACIHMDHARTLLLQDYSFSTEATAINNFRALCREAEYTFSPSEVPYEGRNAALFLSLLLPTCLASPDGTIARSAIKMFARRAQFSEPASSGISFILEFLRDQDVLQFRGATNYGLTQRGQELARAVDGLSTPTIIETP